MPVEVLCTRWDLESAGRFIAHLLAAPPTVKTFIYYEKENPIMLITFFEGPSDIYTCLGENEVFSNEQIRAGYMLYQEPLVAPDQISARTRRLLAIDILRAATHATFDGMFFPEQGVLAPPSGCEFEGVNTTDLRYFYTRIGIAAANLPDCARDPALLYLHTV